MTKNKVPPSPWPGALACAALSVACFLATAGIACTVLPHPSGQAAASDGGYSLIP